MDYSSRIIKSPPATIKEITTQDTSTTPPPEQSKVQTGIASVKDSFDASPAGSLYSANPNTGGLTFGNGIAGKTPPTSQNIDATYRYQGLLQQTKSEITDFLKGGTAQAEPFKAISSYLQDAQKEAREDKKFQLTSRELSLLGAASKINLDNQKIDEQMKEAGEKADAAMDAATTQLVTATISAAVQVGGVASQAKSELAHLNDPAIESRYQQFQSLLNDLQKAVNPASEKKSDLMEKEIQKQEQAANAAKEDSSESSSAAHRDRIRDAILDFIRKMSEIKGLY
jgi:hypothetical protein